MTRLRTWLRYATTLAVLVASCGFLTVCPKGLVFRGGARPGFEWRPVNPLDPRGPRDYFFRLQGQREGGSTIAIAPFFIYPGAFSFEGTGGISDLELVVESSDASACFELFEDGFFGDLDHSVSFCGRYVQGGYQTFNSENSDQRFYPGVYLLDFKIDYDGLNLSYSTRPTGASTYDLVTSVPFDWDGVLIPSIGGIGFHKKGVYDLLELTWTTTTPTDTTFEQGCGWHIQEAYRYDFAALEKLEGAAPDFAGAATDLGLARGELGSAIGLATDILNAKIRKQALRYLARADTRLEKAEGEAADQDADGAVNQLLKSVRDQGTAYQRVFELDFRKEF
jgi:hypothetical protein